MNIDRIIDISKLAGQQALMEPAKGRHTLSAVCSSSPLVPRHRSECTLPINVELLNSASVTRAYKTSQFRCLITDEVYS